MHSLRSVVRALGSRSRGIPYSDPAALERPAQRTTILRVVLGVALCALLVAELALARREAPEQQGFVPQGTSGVVVLDLSESVFKGWFPQIQKAFTKIADAKDPAGLIIFSDTAYELLPPGAPGAELKKVARFFTPVNRPHFTWQAKFINNPWRLTFRGGTKISAGLDLALDALERDRIKNGSVLLISDLDYHVFDLPRLTQALIDFRTAKIPLRIAALGPQPEDREFFAGFVGDDAFVDAARLGRAGVVEQSQVLREEIPWLLMLVGGLLIVFVAANENWCARLSIPAVVGRRGR
jgi:hypothetical protein